MSKTYVLVVDDNAVNLELVVFLLELEDFEVAGVPSVEAFEQSMAARRPDLLLMDIQLPGTDGLELTRRLKADASTAAIPVVALTAYAMKGDEQRMRAAGCDGYISKPIDMTTFADQVRRHLRP